MRKRSERTLREHGLTEETFKALWEAQTGCCAICGISEAELESRTSASRSSLQRLSHSIVKAFPSGVVEGLITADAAGMARYEAIFEDVLKHRRAPGAVLESYAAYRP